MWTGIVRRFSAEDGQFSDDDDDESNRRVTTKAATMTTTMTKDDGVHGVFSPAAQHRNVGAAFHYRPPPLDPVVLHGSSSMAAGLLTATVAEEIRAMVPERLRIVEDWRLVYSLERDGASLATLYQRARPYDGCRVGFVLVVKDQEGGTFGAYLSEHPHPAPSYFGNGECFLWRVSALASLPPPPSSDTTHLTRHTTLATSASGASTPGELIRFKAFPYSGLNDCYMNCEAGFLSVGAGGGHYGLWLDDSLDVGHSSQCNTFGNEPLSDAGEKFGVLGVELWVLGA
ncbi:hypothetical protein L249_7485 [Ophiocordyceps polyrhachis-furcata BCC 54312]|uniref:Oxidation resistance protein 1 n=1 Tax=Ophiocordyceps polyrhachis-furcata BCC 54312 TaxID=1330021 RepID=A0A367LAU1_9HYPO|nr:hypothetical protein L249_7485 [Ophiocordyceps polyrhachis-furcata BCC 54312]